MPSVKDIGKRLKSVTSTSKITKAMKMVAASKLKKAETDMAKARPFAASVQSLMMPHIGVKEEDETSSTVLALAISSDKGLCGGVNSKMAKEVKLGMEAYVGKGVESPEVRCHPAAAAAHTGARILPQLTTQTRGGHSRSPPLLWCRCSCSAARGEMRWRARTANFSKQPTTRPTAARSPSRSPRS